ncbi:hypothetical protein FPQ18DRAFT_172327 [Pyronema domesticum]|nr:hypothetical protein FPQ18DRAFT_172327 [Pyronema domesticum]
MSFMHIFYSGCLLSFPFSMLAFLLFFYTRGGNRVVGFWGLHVVGFVTDCLPGRQYELGPQASQAMLKTTVRQNLGVITSSKFVGFRSFYETFFFI